MLGVFGFEGAACRAQFKRRIGQRSEGRTRSGAACAGWRGACTRSIRQSGTAQRALNLARRKAQSAAGVHLSRLCRCSCGRSVPFFVALGRNAVLATDAVQFEVAIERCLKRVAQLFEDAARPVSTELPPLALDESARACCSAGVSFCLSARASSSVACRRRL